MFTFSYRLNGLVLKKIALLFICILPWFANAQKLVELDPTAPYTDITFQGTILEDEKKVLTIDDVIAGNTEAFQPITSTNLDFTASSFWLKFKVQLSGNHTKKFYLETARPITNKVVLYELQGGQVVQSHRSGGDFVRSDRQIDHRKNIFALTLQPGQVQEFILELGSNGEQITIPTLLWNEAAFQSNSNTDQLMLGLYYGALLFILVIFFFFYVVLRDKSFLYYVLFVSFIFTLQFSLDGLTNKYIFGNFPWLSSRIVVWSAAVATIFVLLYAKVFLRIAERLPKLNRWYNIFIWYAALLIVLTFFKGKVYELTFPLINLCTLISTLFIPATILIVHRRGHQVSFFFSMAFVTLVAGAVIFIIGNVGLINFNVNPATILKIASILEVTFLSIAMANKYRDLQKAKEVAQAELLVQLEEKNRIQANINERLESEVKARTAEIEEQKEQLAEKNKDILDSIHYAKRIQQAIMPSSRYVKTLLPSSFIFYRPRDIVSGDFYWIAEVQPEADEKLIVFAAADCTGHGVPGAFVSIVGNNFLQLGQSESNVKTPAEALNFLNAGISKTFSNPESTEDITVRDGMDIALCAINFDKGLLHYAGAQNPVYIIRKNGEPLDLPNTREFVEGDYTLYEIIADKQPIGAGYSDTVTSFTDRTFKLEKGDTIYTFSDGFPDQFGGKRGKKFMYKRFKRQLLAIQEKSMEEQETILGKILDAWMFNAETDTTFEQVDDILIIGVRY